MEAEITRRLRSEFASLLKPRHPWPSTPAAGDGASAGNGAGGGPARGGSGTGGAARESKRQALLSCLRPFSALGSGIEAEKQFARCGRGMGRFVGAAWGSAYSHESVKGLVAYRRGT